MTTCVHCMARVLCLKDSLACRESGALFLWLMQGIFTVIPSSFFALSFYWEGNTESNEAETVSFLFLGVEGVNMQMTGACWDLLFSF